MIIWSLILTYLNVCLQGCTMHFELTNFTLQSLPLAGSIEYNLPYEAVKIIVPFLFGENHVQCLLQSPLKTNNVWALNISENNWVQHLCLLMCISTHLPEKISHISVWSIYCTKAWKHCHHRNPNDTNSADQLFNRKYAYQTRVSIEIINIDYYYNSVSCIHISIRLYKSNSLCKILNYKLWWIAF